MIDTDFLHQLDRFSLIITKRITSNYVGERKSAATGHGLIFKDHIIYEPGEDFRTIDWKLYARTDKLFVKRFEEERNLTVHVILDFSASMNFGKKETKAEYGAKIGVGFAYLALKNNERFVLSTFSDSLEVFKPKKGRSQLANLVAYLNSKKPKGTATIDVSLSSYKSLVKTKSYIVIISDFLYPIEQISTALHKFKGHQVLLIQVLDQIERDLNIKGDFKLKDLESKSVLRTFINPFIRKKYKSMLSEHNGKIREACTAVGAKFYEASTGQNIFDVFYDVLRM
ncbi:DUF58 domain-containing protein [Candidatus Woesearchaeota archaeon]|nr:MAG: DUF58 domain-containing protein [Candidatus Woesearchaeota archaeon]